jgi:S-adenosyl methyltransferase
MSGPGLVSIPQWRPDTAEVGKAKLMHAAYGAVARKP